ncbi:hypothetical protein B0H63DRAFT_444327 [Podospora didyma]|uniref:AA1-like domain-containing protein n=1 Tax=Podospora didyma TaxID=330526 RepID=A0AAE0P658_9PEZI|nr:hypothetical protein B0H63DRAFT_444327 [Podospora didyma]
MILNITALVAVVLATALPAASLPAYKIPAALKALAELDNGCFYPANYTVQNFSVWTPAVGSNQTEIVDFEFTDKDTGIDTLCHRDAASKNVGPEGLNPRWACDNSTVTFVWEPSMNRLTMIEKACPQGGNSDFEASGSVRPSLTCVKTEQTSSFGPGSHCLSIQESIDGKFTSLQPTPN